MASDFRLKDQLPELTKRIVATYTPDDGMNHLGHCPLPSYEAVVEVLVDLKDVLYPGYRNRQSGIGTLAQWQAGELRPLQGCQQVIAFADVIRGRHIPGSLAGQLATATEALNALRLAWRVRDAIAGKIR